MTPDYSVNAPAGWCGDPQRGAAHGRPCILPDDRNAPTEKLYLRQVPVDSGGYDPKGAYFGHNRQTLYWCADSKLSVDFMLWAKSRAQAKETVRHLLPNARFRR